MGQGLVIAETSHAVIIIALQRMTNKITFKVALVSKFLFSYFLKMLLKLFINNMYITRALIGRNPCLDQAIQTRKFKVPSRGNSNFVVIL